MKYNLDFKNQARVVKFEIMDAIDTRITKIKKKFLGHKSWRPFWILGPKLPKIEFFCYRNSKKQTIAFKYNIMSDIYLKNDNLL